VSSNSHLLSSGEQSCTAKKIKIKDTSDAPVQTYCGSASTVSLLSQCNDKIEVSDMKYGPTIDTYLCPTFKRSQPINLEHSIAVKESWSLITRGKTRFFREMGQDNGYTDPIAFFSYSFYGNVFVAIPRAQDYLRNDPHQQYYKLFKIVDMLVNFPSFKEEELNQTFRAIGKVHQKFRVRPSWYSQFGAILLKLILDHLLEKATEDVVTGWTALIGFLVRGLLYRYLKDSAETNTEAEQPS